MNKKEMSGKIWFTSDTHFSHRNVIQYCPERRSLLSFGTIKELDDAMHGAVDRAMDEMNAELIKRWNAVVADGDAVYHLGDFAMGSRKRIPEYLEQLNGTIVLIAGNHDHKKSDGCFTHVVRPGTIVEVEDGIRVELIHNPQDVEGHAEIAFCGHVHDLWTHQRKGHTIPEYKTEHRDEKPFVAPCAIYNVGVDVRGYQPRSFREIVMHDAKTDGERTRIRPRDSQDSDCKRESI